MTLKIQNISTASDKSHKKYAIVYGDECNNNVILICKKYCIYCNEKELNLNDNHCNSDTYVKMNINLNDIVDEHVKYMKLNKLNMNKEWIK